MNPATRAGPYGPHCAPPPPSGPPPAPQKPDIGKPRAEGEDMSANSDKFDQERGHHRDVCERRQHDADQLQHRRSSPSYTITKERRGRSRSPSRHDRDDRPEHHRYRERSPRSNTTPNETSSYGEGRSSSPTRFVGGDARYSRDSSRYSGARYRSPLRRDARENNHDSQQQSARPHPEYTHRRRHRSPTPVSIREDRIRGTFIPPTAYPLRAYTNHIAEQHGSGRRETYENRRLPAFRNGDGKVNPSAYGSVLQYDLGLCYGTFKTMYMCEMGVRCPWRHHPLSVREKDWIVEIAGEKGREFVADAEKAWEYPDVPVPGRNMIEVMQQESEARRRW